MSSPLSPRGTPIARLLATPTPGQLGAVAAIRIDAPLASLVEAYRNIIAFESGDRVLSIGRFSRPPSAEDLASLELPASDLEDLRRCRVGDCPVNLSASAIERFRKDVDWSNADARLQANQIAREALFEYVTGYQARGNDALLVYHHRESPVSLQESSLRLLRESAPLVTELSQVAAYFERYPRVSLPAGAEEFFYWSQVTLSLKPVTRVNHVVLAPGHVAGLSGHVIVSRTLYASHYFLDGLEIRYLVPSEEGLAPRSFYFVSVNRSHSDSLNGLRGLLIGGRVRASVRDSMRRHVEHVKQVVEED